MSAKAAGIQAAFFIIYFAVASLIIYLIDEFSVPTPSDDYDKQVGDDTVEEEWPDSWMQWAPGTECQKPWCPDAYLSVSEHVRECAEVPRVPWHDMIVFDITKKEVEDWIHLGTNEISPFFTDVRHWPLSTVKAMSTFNVSENCRNLTPNQTCSVTFKVNTTAALKSCPLKSLHGFTLDYKNGIIIHSNRIYRLEEIIPFRNGRIFACVNQRPQTNVVGLRLCTASFLKDQSDFRIENGSLILLGSNITFRKPYFATNPNFSDDGLCPNGSRQDAAVVCYPLQMSVFDCAFRRNGMMLINKTLDEIDLQPGLAVYLKYEKRYLSPGQYLRYTSGGIGHCLKLPENNYTFIRKLYAVVSGVSALFVLVMIVITLILPNLNAQNRIILCLAINMVLHYCVIIYLALGTKCTYFFFASWRIVPQATFLWFNVLAYDLWRRLGSTNLSLPANQTVSYLRLVCYAVYAWGSPVFLCTVALIIASNETAHSFFDYKIFDTQACETGKRAFVYFFGGPSAVTMVQNLVLFILTVNNLRKTARQAKLANADAQREILCVFFKLFLVMGPVLLIEQLQLLNPPLTLATVMHLIVMLQGPLFVVVYCFKKSTVQKAVKLLKCVGK